MLFEHPRSFLAALISAGLIFVSFASCEKSAPTAETGPLPVNVITAVEREVTEWDEFTGRIEAVQSVEIRARVSGYLEAVKFKEGAMVKEGDPLFVIDPRPYQADLDRAIADVERAEAQMKLAQIDFDRAKDLREKKVTSPEEFDQKAASLQQAEAGVRSAKAARDLAMLNMEFTQVKSPIDGRVSDARVTVGNLIQAGTGADSVLTTVVSTDPLYVYVDADENNVLKFIKAHAEGTRKSLREATIPAYVQLANEEGFPHEGVLDFADNRIDPTTGTLRVRAVLKAWDDLLTPGFFVRMRVPAGPKATATLVPDKVINSQQGMKFVFVVKPDKTVERRNIETGAIFEGLRTVRSGLKGGEQVVSTRLQLLQPGMPVDPIPEAPEPEAAKPADAK